MSTQSHTTATRVRACLLTIAVGASTVGLCPAKLRADERPAPERQANFTPRTVVSLMGDQWRINDRPTYRGTPAEGLLMNVRMVNAVFEDRGKPDFNPEANTDRFLAHLTDYAEHGTRAFTICLQGGMPGYQGAVNSAFAPDGSLSQQYLSRVERVIQACDRHGLVVILGCFYQRQDQLLAGEAAVRTAVVNVAHWIKDRGFRNVVLEIANEFDHPGFAPLLRSAEFQVELIQLAKKSAPGLLVSTSGLGHGRNPDKIAAAADFLLIHFNGTPLDEIPDRISALKKYKKAIVCNEDEKLGESGARAAEVCVTHGASWGFMAEKVNQHFPFRFDGAKDDAIVYAKLKELTSPPTTPGSTAAKDYFPPPESRGGWRKITEEDSIRRIAGMDPDKLTKLRAWLRQSDDRVFAAVVIRRGYVVLEEERVNSSVSDTGRVASCSKAICATVLAVAAEQSQQGKLPHKMTFDDRAFDFIPWAQPLSDPRKAGITVKQLLNHTSGICPEATGAPNDGSWEYILGHTGDARTAKLAFDPGKACGYSTHALAHAALVCETVTGKPYDQFAIEALFKPLGIEHWWFQYYDGGPEYGRHPSHGLGMPARDMARIAYCMARDGHWNDRQVIPKWFVAQTAAPTHSVQGPEQRFKVNAQNFSHGWELPARLTGQGGRSGRGIPADARSKPGSGGQLMAFVPSLDLVVTRQTGSSGAWPFEEYLRQACAACIAEPHATALGIEDTRFTINGKPTFLLGISDYGALGAPQDFLDRDLDDFERHGFNWLRVWASCNLFDQDISVVDASGRPREKQLSKLTRLVADCDRRGLVVDVTLTRASKTPGWGMPNLEAHARAVETVVTALKSYKNWYLDLANERDVGDERFVPTAEVKSLREVVRRLDPARLVTASMGGHDVSEEDLRESLLMARLDFLTPHRPRNAGSPGQTEAKTRECLAMMKKIGRLVPVLYQEPLRRGYSQGNPSAEDLLSDLRGALAGNAAGWCFHNGPQHGSPENRPRRSFDLRDQRLLDQLDSEERKVVSRASHEVLSHDDAARERKPGSN